MNGNLIFMEIAQGLNREKISLLKYKIPSILDNNPLNNPKLVIMMSDLHLTFVDGINLELLFDNVTNDTRIVRKNIKVLSQDTFVKDFLEGHLLYHGIQIASSISDVLSSLVEHQPFYNTSEIVADKVPGVHKIIKTRIIKQKDFSGGMYLYIEIVLVYGYNIIDSINKFKTNVTRSIENYTGMNVLGVEIVAKNLYVPEKRDIEI